MTLVTNVTCRKFSFKQTVTKTEVSFCCFFFFFDRNCNFTVVPFVLYVLFSCAPLYQNLSYLYDNVYIDFVRVPKFQPKSFRNSALFPLNSRIFVEKFWGILDTLKKYLTGSKLFKATSRPARSTIWTIYWCII